jgi:hypothetical protein
MVKIQDNVVDMISRVVPVDRTRTPQNAIKATSRILYLDDSVLETMPAGGDGVGNVEVLFFKFGRHASDDEVAAEFARLGIEPDPYAVAAVNEADPTFADEHPNGTLWKDADDWCFVAFSRIDSERSVVVRRDDYGWRNDWWFGGVRKVGA